MDSDFCVFVAVPNIVRRTAHDICSLPKRVCGWFIAAIKDTQAGAKYHALATLSLAAQLQEISR
jgi:hypothetical protein